MKRARPPLLFRLLLLLFPLANCSLMSAQHGVDVSLENDLNRQIDRIAPAFDRALRPAYLAYALSEGSSWSTPSSENPFLQVNLLLAKDVVPLVESTWDLADRYFKSGGEETYRIRLSGWRLRIQGLQLLNLEEYRRAVPALKRALAIYRAADDQEVAILLSNNLAYAYFQLGNLEQALKQGQAAFRGARLLANDFKSALFAYNLGWIYLNSQQFEQAADYLNRAVDFSRQSRNRILQASASINLTIPYLYLGQIQQAHTHLREGSQMASQIGSFRLRAIASYNLAILAAMEGDAFTVRRHLRTVLLLLRDYGDRVFLHSERSLLEKQAIKFLIRSQPGYRANSILSQYVSIESVEQHQKDDPIALHSHAAHMLARFGSAVLQAGTTTGQTDDTSPSRVTLGSVLTFPDSSSTLPVHFTPSTGVRVGSLELEIGLPHGVSFISVAKAPPLEELGVELTTEIRKNNVDAEGSSLQIRLVVEENRADPEPLPEGLLLYLTVAFTETVHPGSLILENRARAQDLSAPAQPIQPLIFEDTRITVLDNESAPAMVCFYYLH